MAILRLQDGTTYTALSDITRELVDLQIQLKRWSVGENPQLHRLLAQNILSEAEKEQVLQALNHYFEELKQTHGYQSQDLIVLHPALPDLDKLLAKFNRTHTHAADEVRYIIDGEGVFVFVRPDGSQVELIVQAEEYINVPAGTEHYFYLTASRRLKAVRYFTDTVGWTPEYTQTETRFRQVAV